MFTLRERTRAVAAVEFGILAPALVIILMNLFDVGSYVYISMQVAYAAQMGTLAARNSCDPSQQPATTRCSSLNTAVNAAVSSTSLGANVISTISEGYYCVTRSNALQSVSGHGDCTVALGESQSEGIAGDYITVQASYKYSSLIPLSVASQFPTPIVRSSMARID